MAPRLAQALGIAGVALVAAWWGRLKAHSKTPPPEGRWREVREEELTHKQ